PLLLMCEGTNNIQCLADPKLSSTVPRLLCLELRSKLLLARNVDVVKLDRDVLEKCRLVVLDCDDEVSPCFHDLVEDGLLASRCVDGHECPFEVQKLEQTGNRGDLVGLRVRLDLSENQ